MTDPRKPFFDGLRTTLNRPLVQSEVVAGNLFLDGLMQPSAQPQQIGLTADDFAHAARALQCTVAQIRAVDEVESGGGWFKDVRADILAVDGPGGFVDGPNLPKILFEAHISIARPAAVSASRTPISAARGGTRRSTSAGRRNGPACGVRWNWTARRR